MTKAKYFILIFMVVALTSMIPNISNAATREEYYDDAQDVTWSYEIDENGNVINLALETTDVQGTITIPEAINGKTVSSLKEGSGVYGGGAFQECSELTEIIIPSSITKLSNYCFGDCTNLKSIEIPDRVTSIGSNCFNNCDALTSITIPANITSIGTNAFYGCDILTSVTISNPSTSVETGVFKSCKELTTVNLPSSMTKIPENLFYNCESLKSITLPDNITSIEGAAFQKCTSLTSIDIPAKVTSIGANAFNGCTSLTSITIPNTVETIGAHAFDGCTSLESVKLSESITTLEHAVFKGCTALTSIKIPDSVETIYREEENFTTLYGTFNGCTNLQKILIPDTVTTIYEGAFEKCSNLTIYSNKYSAAYNFADAYNILWLPIEDWDKQTSGTDLTKPTVESIEVPLVDYFLENENKESKLYILVSGKKITIEVKFNENIKATTLPALTIKFGEGNNIKLTNGVVSENKITYEYTIKDTDKGILATVDFSGGDIKDEAGNAAVLTCPALKKLYNDYYLYANGEVIDNGNTDNGSSNDDTDTNNSEQQGITKKQYNNHYYYIFEQNITWKEAKEFCEKQGGYLVTITSAEEQKFIENYIKEKNMNDKRFWIGATDSIKGTWSWVTEEKYDYTNWGEDQPDLSSQSYAAILGYAAKYNGDLIEAGEWDNLQNEGDSNKNIYFICEWGDVEKADNTIATEKLPQTGVGIGAIISVIILSAICIVAYSNYRKFKCL